MIQAKILEVNRGSLKTISMVLLIWDYNQPGLTVLSYEL